MISKSWKKFKKTITTRSYYWIASAFILCLTGILFLIESAQYLTKNEFLSYIEKNPDTYKLALPSSSGAPPNKLISYVVVSSNSSWFNAMEVSISENEQSSFLKELESKNQSAIQANSTSSLLSVTIDPTTSVYYRIKYRPFSFLLYSSLCFFILGFLVWLFKETSFKVAFSNNSTYKRAQYGVQSNHQNNSQNQESEVEEPLSFADVAGIDEVKEQIQEIVQLFNDSSKIAAMGGKIPRGVLLNGPPGTGKTLLAKVTASQCNAQFLHASGSEFVEMYVGVGARRIRDLFNKAKSLAPCIIFIDEIDAVGGKRGTDNNSEREQTLNELLVQMDGFSGTDNILIFAATNQIDKLDSALLRPGRFDRRVYVNLPDATGREQILKVYLNKVKISEDVNAAEIARATSGFSGADLANLVNEAILYAARQNKDKAFHQDFIWAKDKIVMGAERRLKLDPQEKIQTAYHEIGHALIGLELNLGRLVNVSIVPRGQALGVTQMESEDILTLSKTKALHQIAMLMGGRVAEKVFFNHLSTGANNDLQRAYNLARQMVGHWGMSDKIGPLGLEDKNSYFTLSEATKKNIDNEILKIIKDGEALAESIILKHKDTVKALSDELFEKETLSCNDVSEFLNNLKKS